MLYTIVKTYCPSWKDKKPADIKLDSIIIPFIAASVEEAQTVMKAMISEQIINEIGLNNFTGIIEENGEMKKPGEKDKICAKFVSDKNIDVYALKEDEKIISGRLWSQVEKCLTYIKFENWSILPAIEISPNITVFQELTEHTIDLPELNCEVAENYQNLMDNLKSALQTRLKKIETGEINIDQIANGNYSSVFLREKEKKEDEDESSSDTSSTTSETD